MLSGDRGQDWSDVAISQGTPKRDGHHWKLGSGKEDSVWSLRGSMDLLVL
jgi:hypothetical protein